MLRIFISRDLKKTSSFFDLLTLAEHIVLSYSSLIEIKSILFDKIPSADWLFFYSQSGIKKFFEKAVFLDFDKSSYRYATIGKSTAELLETYIQRSPDFIGTGNDMVEIAQKFYEAAKDKKTLFIQAENSQRSVQKQIEQIAVTETLIVYSNEKKTIGAAIEADILVFTSPLNVEAYFDMPSFYEPSYFVAIGRTTEKALLKAGVPENKIFIAEEPTELSLMQKTKELILTHRIF